MALLDGLFKKQYNNKYSYAKMIDGSIPIYSQRGRDIYASDVVQMAINCIAEEIGKLQPRHIRTDNNGMIETPKSSINRLFKFSPNPLMTTSEFLEKIIWLLYINYNAFIYPSYIFNKDARERNKREYTALFPLNPKMVTFLQDNTGKLFIKMDFDNAKNITLPYDAVIHLRKKFSINEIMGGGVNGQPDNSALLKVININDTVIDGLGKAINTSLGVRGIISINTMIDEEKVEAERKRFEDAIATGKNGILAMDLKSDFINLNVDPKIIDKETIKFIQDKILCWYGVPLKILSGNFNDEDYQAFYEKTLERSIISFGQAFSKTMFTIGELNHGNEIVFYNRDMMYLSTSSKLKMLEIAGAQGLFTDDQKLKILGYPPLKDGTGNRRTISLNYISTEIADEYQLRRAGNSRSNRKEEDEDDN